MPYRFSIGEATIASRPGEPARIVVAAGEDGPDRPVSFSVTTTGSKWVSFCHGAGADVAQLFYGRGWQHADRRCRDGFHREVPLIQASGAPTTLCCGDLKVIRRALEGGSELDAATIESLSWLENAFEVALDRCRVPVFCVSESLSTN